MSDTIETVGQLLNADPNGLSGVQLKLLNGSEAMTALRVALSLVPADALSDLTGAVGDALQPVFQMRLGDVLAGAWNTGRKLLPYRKQAPGKTENVALGKHSIESALHPRIGVAVHGVAVPKAEITLDLTLELEIQGAVLRVRDAHIVGASVAKCEGKGKLICGKATLLERSLFQFEIPAISFGKGIAI